MSVRPLKVSRARLADANELAMEKEKAEKVSKERRKKRRKSRKTGSCTDQQSDSTSLATGVATSELSGTTDQQLDVTDGAGAGSSNFATPNEGSPQAALNLSTTANRNWSSKSSLNSDATPSPRADDLLPTGVATASPTASRKEEGLPVAKSQGASGMDKSGPSVGASGPASMSTSREQPETETERQLKGERRHLMLQLDHISEQHQASLRSNSELRKAVSQLEYENENIKRHYFEPQAEDILPKVYRNLDHQVDAMKEKVTKLEVENMKLILDKEAAEYKLSDLLNRLDLQQAQVLKLTDQIGTLEASVASGAEVKANLELQLAKVQAKNNLKDKEVKQLKDQLLALNSKLEVANKVLEPQNLDVLKSRTSLAKEMKEKMSQLEGENKELVHSLASAKARLTTSKDDVAQLTEEVKFLKFLKEKEGLELKEVKEQLLGSKDENVQLTSKIESLEAAIASSNKVKTRLEGQLTKLEVKNILKDKESNELIIEKERQVNDLKGQVLSLQSQSSDFEQLQCEKNYELSELRDEVCRLKEGEQFVQNVFKHLTDLETSVVNDINAVNSLFTKRRQQIANLKSHMADNLYSSESTDVEK